MLSGISLKWIPFLLFTFLQGYLGHRFFAEKTCENLIRGGSIQFFGSTSGREKFGSLVERVNKLVGDLRVDRLKIYIVKEQPANRSFLFYGRLFAGAGEINSEPEKTRTIFVHEFAHAIFENHFVVFNGDKRLTHTQFLKLLITSPTPELLKQMEYIYAYTETFADLVAILDAGDPSVVPRAHGFVSAAELGLIEKSLTEEQLNDHKYRPLDFTALLNFRDWDEFMAKLASQPHFDFQKRYKQIAPVRGVLWRLYGQYATHEQVPTLLQAYLQAASEHLMYVSTREGLTYAEINQRFLQILMQKIRPLRPD
jgi:hypothetical protein